MSTAAPTPASNDFLYEIRCSACWRTLGVSGSKKWGMYCNVFCASDIPAVEQEGRDAVIEAYHRDSDTPVAEMARWFGFSRQRLYQLLDARDLKKAAAKA